MFFLNSKVFCLIFLGISFGNADNSCGQKPLQQGNVLERETAQNEWPWLASLFAVPTNKFFCAGTIISANRVLTAANCIQEKEESETRKPTDIVVHLGKHNLSDTNEVDAQTFNPTRFIVHPDWDVTSERWEADIAILESDTAIQFSAKISAVCLWTDDKESETQVGIIVGWGAKEEADEGFGDFPRQLEVKRMRDIKCVLQYPSFIEIISDQDRTFCAKGVIENTGPCAGDAGKNH